MCVLLGLGQPGVGTPVQGRETERCGSQSAHPRPQRLLALCKPCSLPEDPAAGGFRPVRRRTEAAGILRELEAAVQIIVHEAVRRLQHIDSWIISVSSI